jgi:hypothetical protein
VCGGWKHIMRNSYIYLTNTGKNSPPFLWQSYRENRQQQTKKGISKWIYYIYSVYLLFYTVFSILADCHASIGPFNLTQTEGRRLARRASHALSLWEKHASYDKMHSSHSFSIWINKPARYCSNLQQKD